MTPVCELLLTFSYGCLVDRLHYCLFVDRNRYSHNERDNGRDCGRSPVTCHDYRCIYLTTYKQGIYPTILIVLVNYRTTQRHNEWGYVPNDLRVQRQEPSGVEASQSSRPYVLNGVSITQDQAHGDDVGSGGVQEVDIADRKVPGTLV